MSIENPLFLSFFLSPSISYAMLSIAGAEGLLRSLTRSHARSLHPATTTNSNPLASKPGDLCKEKKHPTLFFATPFFFLCFSCGSFLLEFFLSLSLFSLYSAEKHKHTHRKVTSRRRFLPVCLSPFLLTLFLFLPSLPSLLPFPVLPPQVVKWLSRWHSVVVKKGKQNPLLPFDVFFCSFLAILFIYLMFFYPFFAGSIPSVQSAQSNAIQIPHGCSIGIVSGFPFLCL